MTDAIRVEGIEADTIVGVFDWERRVRQRVRIDVSRVLLGRESVGLAEIAFCAGFSDAAHFSRVFRQHLEVPPSAYRTLVRTEPSAALGGVK